MYGIATHRYARMSAQKLRLSARMISGRSVAHASDLLRFDVRKGARLIYKVLNAAIANAENNHDANVDELYISEIYVNEGPTMKRMRARAKGRGTKIFKRTSHITVRVTQREL